jgi:hypothetical protein
MQQRQLRLGDILDDYCPRERRLANHTIVAMVGDEVRLTRCTTCDTEHPYKGGKAPRLRKKKTSVEAAYDEVLDSVKPHTPAAGAPPMVTNNGAQAAQNDGSGSEGEQGDSSQPSIPPSNGSGAPAPPEEVRLHRPLIRAQLPRVEREPVARAIPEFTIRQASKRQGRFQNARPPGRFAKAGGGGGVNNRSGNSRGPGGPQHGVRQGGRPQGQNSPSRPGGGRHQQRGGKKPTR